MKKELPIVDKGKTIKEVMKYIGKYNLGIVFIVDAGKLVGVVTDGDIRRAILKGHNIDDSVEGVMNKKPIVVYENWPQEKMQEYLNSKKILNQIPKEGVLKIPVLNNNECIRDIIRAYKKDSGRIEIHKQKEKIFDIKAGHIKRILVIGGAGYLGFVLVSKLLRQGYGVRVLDNLTYGDKGIKNLLSKQKFEFMKGDIRNISNIVEAIKDIDAVIHLAAIVGDPACAVNPQETIEINCLAMYNIVEACKFFMVNRFIFSSTCSVYGESLNSDEELTESSPLRPVSLYARTKIRCEEKILDAIDGNFYPTILRMATLYGYSDNMRFDLVVNLLIAKALFEKKITIFGGSQWRPFAHLEDAAEAYIKCLESPLEKIGRNIFNVVSENYRIIDIGNIIKSVCPEAELEVKDEVLDKRNYKVSSNKIFHDLGYKPQKKVIDAVVEIKEEFEKGTLRDYKDSRYQISLPPTMVR